MHSNVRSARSAMTAFTCTTRRRRTSTSSACRRGEGASRRESVVTRTSPRTPVSPCTREFGYIRHGTPLLHGSDADVAGIARAADAPAACKGTAHEVDLFRSLLEPHACDRSRERASRPPHDAPRGRRGTGGAKGYSGCRSVCAKSGSPSVSTLATTRCPAQSRASASRLPGQRRGRDRTTQPRNGRSPAARCPAPTRRSRRRSAPGEEQSPAARPEGASA